MTPPLPPLQQADLPHAPAFSLPNAARVIGAGTILLGLSLGAGDWLVGPAAVVKHGAGILWICTCSVILQALLNTEMARYTLATGEPIYSGFMRTGPGPRFWGWTYALLHLAQLGWAGWAAAAGSALAGLFLGRMPRGEDGTAVIALGYLVFGAAVGCALLGARAQRRIDRAEWIMLGWTLAFLVAVGVALIPPDVWARVVAGFAAPLFGGAALPANADWALLVALAAYSGAGGIVNASFTQWLRDKGFGMAGTSGVRPTAIGGAAVPLATVGATFPITDANLEKWREWWRYLRSDLWFLWTPACLIGIALPAVIAAGVVPAGAPMGGPGAGAALAHTLGSRHGLALGLLALATGFWILASTQLGVAAGFARSVTEILWTGGVSADARRIYRIALVVYGAGGCLALSQAEPLALILVGGAFTALNFVVLALHTLWVNRRLLPRELRPAAWREIAVLACALFFAALLARALSDPAALSDLLAR